ncbi:MAG: alpha/beta hydrolase [Henriciella sp.]|nr:alpha/beta hydrolase [Henriciella sp.]
MTTAHLLDPAVRPAIETIPDLELSPEALPLIRQAMAEAFELADAAAAGVVREAVEIPGLSPDQPAIRGLMYTPAEPQHVEAAYLHVHGGGYVVGAPEMSDASNVHLCSRLGIRILSVDYRLAPEHPVPAPLEDCYAALAWLHQNADQFSLDPARIAVGGESAGGGLAAALVQHAHAQRAYPICFQLLTYPMLDDRTRQSDGEADSTTGEFVWNRAQNRTGWTCYLGEGTPAAPSVPARADRLDGLPPAWIGTAALDLFRDENMTYAQRLMNAGVATELIIYPSVCHGFQWAVDAPVTKQYVRDHMEALQRGLGL